SSCFHAHAAPQSSPLSLHDALPILLNQSVLLAGVNDSADVLVELSETLFDAGVLPYYLHLLDKVHGAAHFDVAEQDAIALHEQIDRKSTRLNSSHVKISYAVFCLKK